MRQSSIVHRTLSYHEYWLVKSYGEDFSLIDSKEGFNSSGLFNNIELEAVYRAITSAETRRMLGMSAKLPRTSVEDAVFLVALKDDTVYYDLDIEALKEIVAQRGMRNVRGIYQLEVDVLEAHNAMISPEMGERIPNSIVRGTTTEDMRAFFAD